MKNFKKLFICFLLSLVGSNLQAAEDQILVKVQQTTDTFITLSFPYQDYTIEELLTKAKKKLGIPVDRSLRLIYKAKGLHQTSQRLSEYNIPKGATLGLPAAWQIVNSLKSNAPKKLEKDQDPDHDSPKLLNQLNDSLHPQNDDEYNTWSLENKIIVFGSLTLAIALFIGSKLYFFPKRKPKKIENEDENPYTRPQPRRRRLITAY